MKNILRRCAEDFDTLVDILCGFLQGCISDLWMFTCFLDSDFRVRLQAANSCTVLFRVFTEVRQVFSDLYDVIVPQSNASWSWAYRKQCLGQPTMPFEFQVTTALTLAEIVHHSPENERLALERLLLYSRGSCEKLLTTLLERIRLKFDFLHAVLYWFLIYKARI